MNRLINASYTIIYIALFSVNLYAADLVNADDSSYTIFVDLDDISTTITIAPKETISDICKDCYIEIDGNPDGVSIDNQEKVVIMGGKLVIEENT